MPRAAFAILRLCNSPNTERIHELSSSDHRARRLAVHRDCSRHRAVDPCCRGFGFAWPFWLLLVFVVQFFRDPQRPIPAQPNAVLCPADGRIVAVETTQDPYANREALKISVFMNVFNVHSQRSPVDGAISKVEYFRARS